MSVGRRIGGRLRGFASATLQVTPAALALVVLSNDLDSFAFLIMLGVFTALATALAAALAYYEREVLRPVPPERLRRHPMRLRLFT